MQKLVNSAFWPALLSGIIAPGVGQILNRHLAKGIFLLTSFFVAFIWFSNKLTDQLSLFLPGNPEQWQQDKMALKEGVSRLIQDNPGFFITFHLLMLTLWIYGIVDAYIGAKQRKSLPQPETKDDENLFR